MRTHLLRRLDTSDSDISLEQLFKRMGHPCTSSALCMATEYTPISSDRYKIPECAEAAQRQAPSTHPGMCSAMGRTCLTEAKSC